MCIGWGNQGAGAQCASAEHSGVPPEGGGESSSSESLLLQAASIVINEKPSAHASLRAVSQRSKLLRIIVSYRQESAHAESCREARLRTLRNHKKVARRLTHDQTTFRVDQKGGQSAEVRGASLCTEKCIFLTMMRRDWMKSD